MGGPKIKARIQNVKERLDDGIRCPRGTFARCHIVRVKATTLGVYVIYPPKHLSFTIHQNSAKARGSRTGGAQIYIYIYIYMENMSG